jgi:iron complex transport system ATP-binding protein
MNLEVGDVSFKYGSKEVLDGITFSARKGEVVGILGENGCGKTTLLKCINMLLKPEEGRILLNEIPEGVLEPNSKSASGDGGAEVSKMKPKELARSMGVVSQSSYVTFPYTALDAVMMGRYARSSNAERSRTEDLEAAYLSLKNAGALAYADRNVVELSGGEFRRVMIARALSQEPAILLLDEPTLHLDVSHQFDLMDLVKKLAGEMGLLVVLVTHDMVFAARYCDKILLMEKGQIISAGTTEEVMTEENMRDVFHVNTEIRYDERIRGLNVMMLNKCAENTRGYDL